MSTKYWREELRELIFNKFGKEALSLQETKEELDFKTYFWKLFEADGRCVLFKMLVDVCGFEITRSTYQAFCESSLPFQYQNPLDETSLVLLDVKVKQTNMGHYAQGYILKAKAQMTTGEEAERLHWASNDHFFQALCSRPDDKRTLVGIADNFMAIGCLKHQRDNTVGSAFDLAKHFYESALKLDPNYSNSLFKYACFLEHIDQTERAEQFYLASLEADPLHVSCLTTYADFLATTEQFDAAEMFYAQSLRVQHTNCYTMNNYACFLTWILEGKRSESLNKASGLFRQTHDEVLYSADLFTQKDKMLRNFAIFQRYPPF